MAPAMIAPEIAREKRPAMLCMAIAMAPRWRPRERPKYVAPAIYGVRDGARARFTVCVCVRMCVRAHTIA